MTLSWPEVLARLSRREPLTETEAADTMRVVLGGDATPAQIGAFLSLLHAKGETAEEVTGLARAMVDAAVPCPLGTDEGKFTKEYVPYLSMAKYHATELAVRASSLAVQLLGAAGYMEDHPTEQWYRDAKQLTIVEGTSQVQLGLVARGVLVRDLWWD